MKPGTPPSRDAILEQALALDPTDRAYLADELERSLPQAPFDAPEVIAAWSEEVDRRVAAFDRGETKAIQFEATLQHARQVLAERRSQRPES